MISPTGKGIRSDPKGDGHYGTSRGSRKHKGVDYLCDPEQDIYAPISGIITRIAYPYKDKSYSGVVIEGKHLTVKMFYFEPFPDFIKMEVFQGQVIGFSQDISQRYGGSPMKPHIHLEIVNIDPSIFTELIA